MPDYAEAAERHGWYKDGAKWKHKDNPKVYYNAKQVYDELVPDSEKRPTTVSPPEPKVEEKKPEAEKKPDPVKPETDIDRPKPDLDVKAYEADKLKDKEVHPDTTWRVPQHEGMGKATPDWDKEDYEKTEWKDPFVYKAPEPQKGHTISTTLPKPKAKPKK